MPKDFMDSITASKGELRISGGVCSGNVSLKWAEEKSLCTPGSQVIRTRPVMSSSCQ